MNLNFPKPVIFDHRSFIYLSPGQSHQLAFSLACQINQQINQGKLPKPEVLVGVARGAYAWLTTLADWLGIDQINTLRISHYGGIAKPLPEPVVLNTQLQDLNRKRILLFDNVLETGQTFSLARQILSSYQPENIMTASLFIKTSSPEKPDFFCQSTSAWIVFYFDITESVKYLGSTWIAQGLDLETIHQRFLAIGIPQDEIVFAMKQIFNFQPA